MMSCDTQTQAAASSLLASCPNNFSAIQLRIILKTQGRRAGSSVPEEAALLFMRVYIIGV